jgi:hypothetical protein
VCLTPSAKGATVSVGSLAFVREVVVLIGAPLAWPCRELLCVQQAKSALLAALDADVELPTAVVAEPDAPDFIAPHASESTPCTAGAGDVSTEECHTSVVTDLSHRCVIPPSAATHSNAAQTNA